MDQYGSSSVNLNEFQDFMLLYPSTDMREMIDGVGYTQTTLRMAECDFMHNVLEKQKKDGSFDFYADSAKN
ncbi:hypothetical protein CAEBREN_07816 [Caenorhabditis brenneri]|uniref:Uncharacterized protein n=1 Tax=Caenorhabditis brenneri TaxID=135651 RepID=G0NIC7_CAEBE|nr:hypothetical protein CAEBREN_07816 [Caenorhabditis brenneri]